MTGSATIHAMSVRIFYDLTTFNRSVLASTLRSCSLDPTVSDRQTRIPAWWIRRKHDDRLDARRRFAAATAEVVCNARPGRTSYNKRNSGLECIARRT